MPLGTDARLDKIESVHGASLTLTLINQTFDNNNGQLNRYDARPILRNGGNHINKGTCDKSSGGLVSTCAASSQQRMIVFNAK